jgi:hypothetical protein
MTIRQSTGKRRGRRANRPFAKPYTLRVARR